MMQRVLLAVSCIWIAVLLLAPALADQRGVFALSVALIAINAIYSLWRITRRRKVLIALNCVQIVLFGAINYQLCQAFGEQHFRFDREPRFYDWIEYTAAHVVRAADLLDALDPYGIHIHGITHQSAWAGLILVAMHLTVDVFLIGIVLRWASRLRQDWPSETRLERGRREFGWLLVTLALFVLFALSQRMRPIDWLLWPVDNLTRLIDVGDVMDVYGWRLHDVEPTYWTNFAGLLFRLCAGIWMARLINLWRLTVFRTWGLSIEELTELLEDADAQIRRGAIDGLGRSGVDALPTVPRLIEALRDCNAGVRCMAAWALGQVGPAANEAVASLVEAVWRQDVDLRLAALEALRRMGPAARSAAHDLVFLLKAGDLPTQQAAARALDAIAPGLRDSLGADFKAKPKSTKRPSRRKAKRQHNWQRCVDASLDRQAKETALVAQLHTLLTEGYFVIPRDTKAIRAALAKRGELVESKLLFLPLLRLTYANQLSRRMSAGVWLYHEAAAIPA